MPLLRYEFLRLGANRTGYGGAVAEAESGRPLKSGNLEISSTPTAAGSQVVVPSTGEPGNVFVRLYLLDTGAAWVTIGDAPDPNTEPRILMFVGGSRLIAAMPGQKLSARTVEVGQNTAQAAFTATAST